MKTNQHSSKFWTILCLMACLLIGSGTAKAEEWLYESNSINLTINGEKVKIRTSIKSTDGTLIINNTDEIEALANGPTSLDLSTPIKDKDGNTYQISTLINSSFRLGSLEEVIIPASVNSFMGATFSNCTNLKKVTYLGTVEPKFTSMTGGTPFANGPADRVLHLPNASSTNGFTKSNWGVAEIINAPTWTFDASAKTLTHKDSLIMLTATATDNTLTITGVDTLKTATVDLNGLIEDTDGHTYTLVAIGDSAFHKDTTLTSMILPDKVVSIGVEAFSSCKKLTGIVYNGVTEIGENAFSASGKFATSTMPKGLKTIGEGAFQLTAIAGSITLPESLTSIGKMAFTACPGITQVSLPSAITALPEGVFVFCTRLASISLTNVDSIGKAAFQSCVSLEKITLSTKLTTLGEGSFNTCSSLVSIICPTEAEPTIGQDAFANGPATGRKVYASKATSENWNASGQWGTDAEVIYAFDWALDKAANTLTSKDETITLGVTFDKDGAQEYMSLASLGTFAGDTLNLTGTIGDTDSLYSLEAIGAEAFKDKVLKKVVLPASITKISANSFAGASLDTLVLKGDRPAITLADTLSMKDKPLCIVRVADDKLSAYHVEDLTKKTYANWGGMPYILGESGKLAAFAYTLGDDTTDDDLLFPDFKALKAPVGQLFQFKLVAAADTTYKLKVEGFDGTTPLDSVSYKDSIVSINLTAEPTSLSLKVTIIKPITAETTDGLYIGSNDTYKDSENGTEKPFNGYIGDGENAFDVPKLVFDLQSNDITIALRNVKVATPAAPGAYSTTIDGDNDLVLTLFGENSLGTVNNNGTMVIEAGDSTAVLDTVNTKITNNKYFTDASGQIRNVIGKAPLTILPSSSGWEETVLSTDSITLKVNIGKGTDATVLYSWERLVDKVWTAVPDANARTKAATANAPTLKIAAADAGDYRCNVTATYEDEASNQATTTLYNYTTVKVSTPTPPTPPASYYSIVMPLVEGATTTPTHGSYSREEGDNFSFSLTLDEDYNASKPVVKANGVVIEPDEEGRYVIRNIYADTEITITGIEKNTATGIDNPDESAARVWSSNGTMHISTPVAAAVKVYSFAGVLLKDLGTVSGDTQLNLNKGAYIVVIGQQSFKCRM